MYRLYLKVNQGILSSYYGPVRFCLWSLYQEDRACSTFLPSPSPLFCPRFKFRATAHARRCSLIHMSSGSTLGPHVYAFTSKFNIYHKNPLLSPALYIYTEKWKDLFQPQSVNSALQAKVWFSPSWAQFRPKKLYQKAIQAHGRAHCSPGTKSALANWTVLALI